MEIWFSIDRKCEICKSNPAQGKLHYCYHNGMPISMELACVDCADHYLNFNADLDGREYEYELLPVRPEKPTFAFLKGERYEY